MGIIDTYPPTKGTSMSVPAPHSLPPRNATTPHSMRAVIFALIICALLYGIDFACLAIVSGTPHAYTTNIAMPFDLMVCVPAAFYFLVLRPRKLSLVFVLPVIYLGAFVSAQFTQSDSFSLLTVLMPLAFIVDIAIIVPEVRRLNRAFRLARTASTNPLDWFEGPLFNLTSNHLVAHMAALELSIWYYLLGSWKCIPDIPNNCHAFSYHRQNGYLALTGVLMALMPLEAGVVHLMIMQWSNVAATLLTITTLYTLVWIAGNTRAVVLNPLLVDEKLLTVRWGAYFNERIPLSLIECIKTSEPNIPKRERLNMGTFGSTPCWVVLREPISMRNITGTTRPVRAINLSPDDVAGFKKMVLKNQ